MLAGGPTCLHFEGTLPAYNASESIVRSTMAKGLPVTIFRPSIILGQSETGKFKSTSVLYPVLLLNQKLMPETVLPILRRTTLDLVPIDYVAGAILYLMLQPATRDKCFHLAAGSDATIYDGEFTQIIARCLVIPELPSNYSGKSVT